MAELARLDHHGEQERRRLEHDLGAFVAAYQRQVYRPHPPGKQQLCSLFAAAALRPAELCRLEEAEARVSGVVFVAYASPLRRLPPATVTRASKRRNEAERGRVPEVRGALAEPLEDEVVVQPSPHGGVDLEP